MSVFLKSNFAGIGWESHRPSHALKQPAAASNGSIYLCRGSDIWHFPQTGLSISKYVDVKPAKGKIKRWTCYTLKVGALTNKLVYKPIFAYIYDKP